MLRGQASLQELIGRSFMNRKRPGAKGKKQQAPADAASQVAKAQTPDPATNKQPQQQQQVLQPGQVSCPVCGGAIAEKSMNAHLGKAAQQLKCAGGHDGQDRHCCTDTCLARETMQRSKGDAKQSTLAFQHVARPKSAATLIQATSRKLQRSATTVGAVHKTQSINGSARRASSDSALVLSQQQPEQQQAVEQQPAEHRPMAELSPQSQEQSLPVKPWRPITKPKGTLADTHTDRSPISEPNRAPPEPSNNRTSTHSTAEMSTEFVQQLSPRSASKQQDGSVLVQTSIVGRRFRTGVTCSKDTPVCLDRQPDNIRDPNAIQVLDAISKQVLGYLPRDVAQHLASMLDDASVKVAATADEPKSVAAVVPITLKVSPVAACYCLSFLSCRACS